MGIEFSDEGVTTTANIKLFGGLYELVADHPHALSWQASHKKAGPEGPVVIDF